MTIATYTELKTEVADFAHRTDLTAKMDSFCLLAESLINKDLRCKEMETRSSESFNATFYDLPSDYLEMRALEIEYHGRRNAIRQVTPQVLDRSYSTATGSPAAFTIAAGEIEFRPGIDPTEPYTGEITYYAKVPTLTGTATNTVLTGYPMIYLSAMMIQVYLFLQDDGEMGKWVEAYNSQVTQANKQNSAGRYVLPSIQVA